MSFRPPCLRWLVVACMLGMLGGLTPSRAVAQSSSPDINAQNFEPILGPHGVFTVEGSSTVGHLEPWAGLNVDYLSEPVVSGQPDGESRAIVDDQLGLDLRAAIGFFGRTQLGVHMPFYLANGVEFDGVSQSGPTVGDLSIQPKVRILDRNEMPLGLGALIDVTVPTGNGEAFVGASGPTVTPEILIDDVYGPVVLAGNLGVEFQSNREFRNLEIGHDLTYRVGAKYRVLEDRFHVGGELYGETPLANFASRENSPLEGLLGVDVITDIGLVISGGAGGGIAPGIGSPEFRAFLGVSYPGVDRDADGDGIPDADDKCPNKPEDIDGFEDEDGCPDPDNDGDGIVDDADQCPNKPENKNGYQDRDGCPDADKDTDGDGILDMDDECPEKAEDKDGFEDEDGCPDPDNDGDGVADADDECPDELGLDDNAGCPPEEKKALLAAERIKVKAEVRFELASAELKTASKSLLDQVGLVLEKNPDIRKVEVQGHADAKGTEEFNQKLSEKRARVVKDYLVEQTAVSADRLVAEGYGEKEPSVSNQSEEGRSRNRRVVFKVLEEGDGE